MCNACGFYCCGSDEFDRCGCEHCPYRACWPDEDDDFYEDYDDYFQGAVTARRQTPPVHSHFRCEQPAVVAGPGSGGEPSETPAAADLGGE